MKQILLTLLCGLIGHRDNYDGIVPATRCSMIKMRCQHCQRTVIGRDLLKGY